MIHRVSWRVGGWAEESAKDPSATIQRQNLLPFLRIPAFRSSSARQLRQATSLPLCPADLATLTAGVRVRRGVGGESGGLVTQSRMSLRRQPAKGLNLGAGRRASTSALSDDL